METGQRIQTETRRDAEEVMDLDSTALSVLKTLMRRYLTAAGLCVALIASGSAQTSDSVIVIRGDNNPPAYAIHFPKPEYPYDLHRRRARRNESVMSS